MVVIRLKSLLVAVFSLGILFFLNVSGLQAQQPDEAVVAADGEEAYKFDANKVIFSHVMDAHEYHYFSWKDKEGVEHHATLPLPVILYSPQKGWSVFMSSKFHHGEHEVDGYRLEGNKIVPVDPNVTVYDISLTRNVVQMFIAFIVLFLILRSVASKYKKGIGVKTAPKGMQNVIEPIVTFIKDEVAVPNIGIKKYEKYLPLILTLFFFILINNLFGLIPGAANVTGNIAFTLVLGVVSFVVVTISGNKHYWGHIFNPPVPAGINIIMIIVEFLSVFTKPFALIIRLFANMLAGHIIIICLISLIFIFGGMNTAIGWGFSPVSIGFVVFMYFIEFLVAFIQAFIFANLTAVFIGQAVEETHHHDEKHELNLQESTAKYDDPVII